MAWEEGVQDYSRAKKRIPGSRMPPSMDPAWQTLKKSSPSTFSIPLLRPWVGKEYIANKLLDLVWIWAKTLVC
jgi:hypothetical protein